MGRGVNKVIVVGNLGARPDVRHMPNGGLVTNVRLATTEVWRDKQTGEQQERTEWHRVVFFNKLAEIAEKYLDVGTKVYIEGSLRTRKWRDNNNNMDRYTTEIVANDMQILSNRNSGGGNSGSGRHSSQAPYANQEQNQANTFAQSSHSAPSETAGGVGVSSSSSSQQNAAPVTANAGQVDDDDIPF